MLFVRGFHGQVPCMGSNLKNIQGSLFKTGEHLKKINSQENYACKYLKYLSSLFYKGFCMLRGELNTI